MKQGDVVSIAGASRRYRIIDGPDKHNRFLIELGGSGMWVESKQLQVIKSAGDSAQSNKAKKVTGAPERSPRKKSRSRLRSAQLSSMPANDIDRLTLDLHGFTTAEALSALEDIISKALIADASRLAIMHGIGSGKLKTAVHSYLQASPHVANFFVADDNPGLTWVFLA